MEKKKHILFISSWYPNRNDPTFGIFNRFFAEAVSLYHHVSVLNVASELNLPDTYEFTETHEPNLDTVSIYYRKITSKIPLISNIIKRKRVLHAFDMGFKKIVEKNGKPDIIHLNVVMPMGIAAYHLSKKYNIPYVINENWSGYTEEDGQYHGFTQVYFTQKIVKEAKHLMPTSDYLKNAMMKRGLKGNYTVIPNVVNVDAFKPLNHTENKKKKFIHISSLNDREKNVSGLIRAFAQALKTHPGISLNIVGEGVDKEKYKTLVKELGLEAFVSFSGRVVGAELVKMVNSSDALIMFSNYETFCLVIVEAFACGKPVITSNAGAIAGYMRPELGIMVEKRKEDELASAIIKFISTANTYNHQYIRQYAVQNYSYQEVGKKLDGIYTSVLKATLIK